MNKSYSGGSWTTSLEKAAFQNEPEYSILYWIIQNWPNSGQLFGHYTTLKLAQRSFVRRSLAAQPVGWRLAQLRTESRTISRWPM